MHRARDAQSRIRATSLTAHVRRNQRATILGLWCSVFEEIENDSRERGTEKNHIFIQGYSLRLFCVIQYNLKVLYQCRRQSMRLSRLEYPHHVLYRKFHNSIGRALRNVAPCRRTRVAMTTLITCALRRDPQCLKPAVPAKY